jgi:hypothetical protein
MFVLIRAKLESSHLGKARETPKFPCTESIFRSGRGERFTMEKQGVSGLSPLMRNDDKVMHITAGHLGEAENSLGFGGESSVRSTDAAESLWGC